MRRSPYPPLGQYSIDFDSAPEEKSAGVNADNNADERIFYVSFGSGSSGNSCYVGTSQGGVIVDAGIKAEDIEKILAHNGVSMRMVKGVILTHDHNDHVKYAYNLVRSHKHIRIFCTNRVLNAMLRRHNISKRIKDYHSPIFKEIPFKLAQFEITAFEVPHDGQDNMGFSLSFAGRNFVLATDLGSVTERARHYMSRADYLVIEANYDLRMLVNGSYPEYLKARIRTSNGHLDNTDTASFLASLSPALPEFIFLCHLSKDNNRPELALSVVRSALEQKGHTVGTARFTIDDRRADVQLMALPRYDASPWFVFHPRRR